MSMIHDYAFGCRFMKDVTEGFGGNVTCAEGYLLGLWMHECRRVFSDKLVSHADKDWVEDIIVDLCNKNFDAKLTAEVTMDLFDLCHLRIFRSLNHCTLWIS